MKNKYIKSLINFNFAIAFLVPAPTSVLKNASVAKMAKAEGAGQTKQLQNVNGSPSSYIKRAGTEYTYFYMDSFKWAEAESLVGKSFDERWRINKAFIDNQKTLGKEFFLSHDPSNPLISSGYYKLEIDYLTVTLKGKIVKVNDNLWKIVW